MGSAYFPIPYDHTSNQEKFQVPRISLSTGPRISYISIMNNKVKNGKMTKWQSILHMTSKWENKDTLFYPTFKVS